MKQRRDNLALGRTSYLKIRHVDNKLSDALSKLFSGTGIGERYGIRSCRSSGVAGAKRLAGIDEELVGSTDRPEI